MTLLNKARLSEALELAGSYLEDRGISVEVVGIGGSALLLLGFIERPTQDLDLIASVESGTYLKLDELPQGFRSVLLLVLTDFGVENADNQLAPGV